MAHWKKYINPKGYAYYINEELNMKQWDHPKFTEIKRAINDNNHVAYSTYRLALKFRALQRFLYMEDVPLSIVTATFDRYRLGNNRNSLILEPYDLETIISEIFYDAFKTTHKNINITYITEIFLNFLLNVFDCAKKPNQCFQVMSMPQSFRTTLSWLFQNLNNHKFLCQTICHFVIDKQLLHLFFMKVTHHQYDGIQNFVICNDTEQKNNVLPSQEPYPCEPVVISNRERKLHLLSIKVTLGVLCNYFSTQNLHNYFLSLCEDNQNHITRLQLTELLQQIQMVIKYMQEDCFFGPKLINSAFKHCFRNTCGLEVITGKDFISWLESDDYFLSWVPLLLKLKASEPVFHAVKCTTCKTKPIQGLRYQCTKCLKFNQCQNCFLTGKVGRSHKLSHTLREYGTATSRKERSNTILDKICGCFCLKNEERNYDVVMPSVQFLNESIKSHSSIRKRKPNSYEEGQLQSIVYQLQSQNRELQQMLIFGKYSQNDVKQYLEEYKAFMAENVNTLQLLKNQINMSFHENMKCDSRQSCISRIQSMPVINQTNKSSKSLENTTGGSHYGTWGKDHVHPKPPPPQRTKSQNELNDNFDEAVAMLQHVLANFSLEDYLSEGDVNEVNHEYETCVGQNAIYENTVRPKAIRVEVENNDSLSEIFHSNNTQLSGKLSTSSGYATRSEDFQASPKSIDMQAENEEIHDNFGQAVAMLQHILANFSWENYSNDVITTPLKSPATYCLDRSQLTHLSTNQSTPILKNDCSRNGNLERNDSLYQTQNITNTHLLNKMANNSTEYYTLSEDFHMSDVRADLQEPKSPVKLLHGKFEQALEMLQQILANLSMNSIKETNHDHQIPRASLKSTDCSKAKSKDESSLNNSYETLEQLQKILASLSLEPSVNNLTELNITAEEVERMLVSITDKMKNNGCDVSFWV